MKQKISVTVEEKTLKLLEEIMKTGVFRNKSHAVEFGLNKVLGENRPGVANLKEEKIGGKAK